MAGYGSSAVHLEKRKGEREGGGGVSEDESLYEALDRAITARMRLLCEQALRVSDDGGDVTVTIILRDRRIVEMGWKCRATEVGV